MNRKTTLLSYCCLFGFALMQTISAQQIFTNGPISTGATSTNATTAPTGYTWSELQTPNTTLGAGAIYNNALTSDLSLSDDFVVPVGQSWNITSIDFFGYQTGYAGTTIPIDALRVRIWNGDPSLATSTVVFGNMTTSVLNATGSGEAFVYRTATTTGTTRKVWLFKSNVTTTLTSGTYWVEYQVHATNDGSAFFPPVTILGTTTSPSWNGKQRTGTTWAALTDLGSSNPLAAPFNINGTTVLGNASFDFSSKIALYPNPAQNTLTISDNSNSGDASIEITDISGRIIKSLNASFANDLTINVSELTSGNYILKVKSENGTAIKKFIKM